MKILLIPGIGDVHWCMLKMESFIKQHCPGERPEIWLWNFDGRPRTRGFIERIPFVKWGGYWNEPIRKEDKRLFNEMYLQDGANIVSDFHGFDYFICFNGALRSGRGMGDIMPDLDINWNYEIEAYQEDEAWADNLFKGKPFVMAYFSGHGMFKRWVNQMPAIQISSMLTQIQGPVYLTGMEWDQRFSRQIKGRNITNIVGETTFGQLFAMMRRARCFMGWCGGNTIVCTHIGTPTFVFWSQYFPKDFWSNWVDPGQVESTYFPRNVKKYKPEADLKMINGLMEKEKKTNV